MRDAQRVLGDIELALVSVNRIEIEKRLGLIAKRPGSEVIELAGFGGEMGQTD
jgi:hypothetical protein